MSPVESTPTTVVHDDKSIEVLEPKSQRADSSLEKTSPLVEVIDKEVQQAKGAINNSSLSFEEEIAAYQMSPEEIRAAVIDIIAHKREAAAALEKEKRRIEGSKQIAGKVELEETEEQVRKLNFIFLHDILSTAIDLLL